jgi:hypothetical protein
MTQQNDTTKARETYVKEHNEALTKHSYNRYLEDGWVEIANKDPSGRRGVWIKLSNRDAIDSEQTISICYGREGDDHIFEIKPDCAAFYHLRDLYFFADYINELVG